MDFGIFNLLQHRDRSKPPQEVIAEALEHVQLAEQLGFSRAWFAEHHFSNYSLCPSPLIFCNQVAATTKTIRIGCAVLILPLHAPARVIAEIALVDVLSGGRLDVGVGSGYQHYRRRSSRCCFSRSSGSARIFPTTKPRSTRCWT